MLLAVPATSRLRLSALRLDFACGSIDSQGTEIFGKRFFFFFFFFAGKGSSQSKKECKDCHLSVRLLLCVQTSAVLGKQIQIRLIQHAYLRIKAVFWSNTAIEFDKLLFFIFFKQ